MEPLPGNLIGALIGIARATDGNEHLITKESTALLLECLAASPATEEELNTLLSKINALKRSMVPDCFRCANPCGRTDAYDCSRIDAEPESVRNAKYDILSKLQTLSGKPLDRSAEQSLYHWLIALGMEGYSAEELSQIQ